MENHIKHALLNALYTSPEILNSLLDSCGAIIISNIADKVQSSGLYIILADNTPDTASLEQFCILVRCLDHEGIREKLLSISDISGHQKGQEISQNILEIIHKNRLNMEQCVGFGFDGANALSGKITGHKHFFKRIAKIQCIFIVRHIV